MLVDTSLLVRTLQPQHPSCRVANKAIDQLRLERHILHLVPQNLMELWVVATRPISQNGLGMSVADIRSEIARLKTLFVLLPETEAFYPAWERLVSTYQVAGKPAHDARLVAAMHVHHITEILTFDRTGFTRYPGIEVVDPADVLASHP